ncbi:MAG: hypothetical protein LBK99_01500 [Opitutaceae bacterium]|jgi:hypothetical protein|nr:hypothetical protein [Opitutaceae bacterium]
MNTETENTMSPEYSGKILSRLGEMKRLVADAASKFTCLPVDVGITIMMTKTHSSFSVQIEVAGYQVLLPLTGKYSSYIGYGIGENLGDAMNHALHEFRHHWPIAVLVETPTPKAA